MSMPLCIRIEQSRRRTRIKFLERAHVMTVGIELAASAA